MEDGSDRITRRSLLGATGSSMLVTSRGSRPRLDGVRSSTARAEEGDESGTARVDDAPPFPDDPFIVTNFGAQLLSPRGMGWGGWEGSDDLAEALGTLLRFHPDVLDFTVLFPYRGGRPLDHPFQDRATEISSRVGLPSTSGWNPTMAIDEAEAERRYGPFMRANSWEYPDGTPVSHPHGILAETIDGREHRVAYAPGGFGIPSPFAPGTFGLLTAATSTRFSQGFSGFEIDGVDVFNLNGLDFSVWATSAFRDYLETLSPSRLRELGIEDPTSFDVRAYLEANDLTPGASSDPREDPVFREYVLHHHRGVERLFTDVRADVRETFPRRAEAGGVALWGNQFTGNLNNPQQANIYASDHFDVINTELSPSVFLPADTAYKFLLAIGRFRKPVMAKGTLTEVAGLRGSGPFDPERRYPMFSRFQAAEAYASGAIFKIPITSRLPADQTANHWVRRDGTTEEELQSFVDFLWAHGRFFEGVEPDNPVAVVWSLPSRIWRRLPRWGIPPNPWSGPGVNSFLGTTDLLRESQIPYDVLVFGHPQLWDDSEQLDRLREYGAVVLPNLLSVSDAQLSALDRYLSDGGSVIASGTPPSRTVSFEPRDDVAALFDHENAVVLGNDPGRRYEEAGEADGTLVAALQDSGIQPASTTTDPAICVNRSVQTDPRRLLLHVLNYDYDSETDSFARKRDVTIRLPVSDTDVEVARYYSPQTVTNLDVVRNDGTVEVVVPELVEWGFVAFASDRSAIDPPASRQAASDAVENATRTVEVARNEGFGGTLELETASMRLREADIAMSYDEYAAARTAAERAMDQVRRARLRAEESEPQHLLWQLAALVGIGSAVAYLLYRDGDE